MALSGLIICGLKITPSVDKIDTFVSPGVSVGDRDMRLDAGSEFGDSFYASSSIFESS
jgi:hypothetical protein